MDYVEGDDDHGARELREACEQLEALGETAFLSTTAAELANTEIRLGRLDEAERWLRVAERNASSGDASSQAWIELARGQLVLRMVTRPHDTFGGRPPDGRG